MLNLSICNDTNIQIFYLIKSNSSIDISFISSFKDLDIDILNKQNISTNETNINSTQLDNIKKSSPFEIIKYYKLVFSWKNKLNNIGFLIFSFLIILHIPLLIIYFCKGIKPIKEYLEKQMKDNGYI